MALALKLRENRRAIAAGMGFSVGIMVLISTLELIPEATAVMGIGTTLSGAALLWVAHLVIPHTHLFPETGLINRVLFRSAYLVAFGLILHDVPPPLLIPDAQNRDLSDAQAA